MKKAKTLVGVHTHTHTHTLIFSLKKKRGVEVWYLNILKEKKKWKI